MLIESVEKRFGAVEAMPAGHLLQFLSDNGSAYIAHETRRIAKSLGLTPVNTPVCSPQSNGMAESFVNTFKRDYVSRMDLSNAKVVLAQLPAAFEHFNEVHPHSSLKMRSPREFRRQRVEQLRRAQPEQQRYIADRPCPEMQGEDQFPHRGQEDDGDSFDQQDAVECLPGSPSTPG